jgi:hypothetical protein
MRRYLLTLAVVLGGCLSATTVECSGLPDVYVNGEPVLIGGTLPDVIVIDGHHGHHNDDDD